MENLLTEKMIPQDFLGSWNLTPNVRVGKAIQSDAKESGNAMEKLLLAIAEDAETLPTEFHFANGKNSNAKDGKYAMYSCVMKDENGERIMKWAGLKIALRQPEYPKASANDSATLIFNGFPVRHFGGNQCYKMARAFASSLLPKL